MRQFEIRRLRSGGLALLLQHDLLDDLESVIVAPVVSSRELMPIERLRPAIVIDGVRHVILMDRLAAVRRPTIGALVTDCRDRQDAIGLALDLLFKGF